MLAHIQIHNFAIVKTLELDFKHGMTTITGETGAGKSIAIDALGLCLGDRADPSMVRPNEDKTEITALFNIKNTPAAKDWLEENELLDGDECILRRVVTKEGRSRAFINGRAVPASSQKALGQFLINIHGQHAHQRLMRSDFQLILVDQYAGHKALLDCMKQDYQAWRAKRDELVQYQKNKESLAAHQQLLDYQVKELDELGLTKDEYTDLEQEHKRLSNAGEIAQTSQSLIDLLCDNDNANALQLLKLAEQKLATLCSLDNSFNELSTMVNEACIQVQEVSSSVNQYVSSLDMDSSRLQYADERIALIIGLARKHKVLPEELYQTHQNLIEERENLIDSDNQIERLQFELEQCYQQALTSAQKLSESRLQQAKTLNTLISDSMHQLSMPQGEFQIKLTKDVNNSLTPLGIDHIDFLVSTNTGQPLQALAKVVSGGELSRISLAISVITAKKVDTPSLIFDEVDVGISGPTAVVVGKLLRQLGESTQVLCVTHLPQVAGCGHQQMFVSKSSQNGSTTTSMVHLNEEERIQELARLLGGSKITAHTLANARELLVAA